MLTFEAALALVRQKIREKIGAPLVPLAVETVPLSASRGRVLAENLAADRDYPPFDRSTRDGFAVRAADLAQVPATLEILGTARAGSPFAAGVGSGSAVEIMTGAPLPEGANAVVMVEYTREPGASAPGVGAAAGVGAGAGSGAGTDRRIEILRAVQALDNVVRRGSEAAAGSRVLSSGRRLGPGEIGLAAALGRASVSVFARPRVAILPTGDEVVPVEQQPAWFEIRNSNALALAAQVEAAGGVPCLLGIAPDRKDALRSLIEQGLDSDLLVLSGGISVGKYDFVAEILADLGAEFYFQGVAIRPGKPLAFGQARERFFFGLPGNPVSTFVTFELFARPAIALLGGADFDAPVLLKARLARPVRQKTGLSVFMPARVTLDPSRADPVVELVGWQGSGDLVGLAEANCFLALRPEQTEAAAGDWVDVLPKSW
jgi:molybdopterin molybdotransferase